jgi:hypothetical protein
MADPLPTPAVERPPEREPDDNQSPQQRLKCACPSWTTRRECIRIRYADDIRYADLAQWPDDECECPCHETEDYSDDWT